MGLCREGTSGNGYSHQPITDVLEPVTPAMPQEDIKDDNIGWISFSVWKMPRACNTARRKGPVLLYLLQIAPFLNFWGFFFANLLWWVSDIKVGIYALRPAIAVYDGRITYILVAVQYSA